ncbi:MAG: hypothetical protein U1E27_02155, partial [Kiritimatiellia bacterium]|nr:hypothetical protein [Kiritimatiellia bacterium]
LESLPKRNTHVPDTGYLWLRTRTARGPRALSINYIMQWDRSELDRLHVSLFAPHRATHEVGRISYGSQFASMMYATLGHQTVVVNRQNQAPNPSILAAFLDRAELPAALIVENPASPLYPGFDSARAVALLDDVFFIGDLYHAQEGGAHVFDWPFYGPWRPGEPDVQSGLPRFPLPLAPLDEPLGDATDPGYRFLTDAEGIRSDAALTVTFDIARHRDRPAARHYVHFAPMDDALFVRARVPRGYRPKPGPVLLVRQDRRATATWGVAIDVAEPDHDSAVRAIRRTDVTQEGTRLSLNQAVAWEVETRTGRYRVVINRTGTRVRAGELETDQPLAVERIESDSP